jgi:hypothetical protein
MSNFGFSSFNDLINPSQSNNFIAESIQQLKKLFKPVRVLSVVLDESHPRFQELGGWNGLGTIEYEEVADPLSGNPRATAKPLMSNMVKIPLENEIVYLVNLPNTNINVFTTNETEYYINVVSLWNHPHHNAYPSNPNELPPSQQKDYIQTQLGNVRRVTDQSTEINLGKTFKERSNIHPLLPFEGDILYEGRWGNSIRLGSTVPNRPNNWSVVGNSGDPLTIIKNGQGQQTEEGWIPVIEDINKNESSIYLTSTQNVPLVASSVNYFSYKTNPPQVPNQYAGKQILLSSGRLVFNTTEDHILLSSNKSINLNAINGVNIDTPTVTIQSKQCFLGSKNATEPLLLGNRTVDTLNNILTNMSSFLQICSTLVSTPPGTPLVPLNVAATQLNQQILSIQSNLEKLKSNSNYTI